jgi:hypothetical protein
VRKGVKSVALRRVNPYKDEWISEPIPIKRGITDEQFDQGRTTSCTITLGTNAELSGEAIRDLSRLVASARSPEQRPGELIIPEIMGDRFKRLLG